MTGDSEMHDLSRLMSDDHENVERAEEQMMDNCEITSPHLMNMILEEGSPTLPRRPFSHLVDVFLNGRFSQFNP